MLYLSSAVMRPAAGLAMGAALAVATSSLLAQSAPASPSAFLKWSMSRYAAMPTFQAESSLHVTASGSTSTVSTRTIQMVKPNHFRVVGKNAGATQVSISDGKTFIEYMTGGAFPAKSSSAPGSIADAKSIFLGNPMLTGSLFYQFFGGPDRYESLVNETKIAPAFGSGMTVAGATCKVVKFWAQGTYGSTEVAIGERDGLVHNIVYHCEPLVDQMTKMMRSPEFLAQMKKLNQSADPKALAKLMPTSMKGEETFTNIKCGEPIDASVFAAKVPDGQEVREQGGGPKPPVAFGRPAPAITVKSVDGAASSLTALRGRVVLIDFWATWCPPCRKGLPETQALYDAYGKKGLAVLTISDETKGTVTPYLKSNKLTFPAFLDQGGATNKAYHIEAIPTVAVIDRRGNLSSFFVGLQDKAIILAALKKAGLDVK
jgi:thiol-disulfide isomerase/thioredoxin